MTSGESDRLPIRCSARLGVSGRFMFFVVDNASAVGIDADEANGGRRINEAEKCGETAIRGNSCEAGGKNGRPFGSARLKNDLLTEEVEVALIEDSALETFHSSCLLTNNLRQRAVCSNHFDKDGFVIVHTGREETPNAAKLSDRTGRKQAWTSP